MHTSGLGNRDLTAPNLAERVPLVNSNAPVVTIPAAPAVFLARCKVAAHSADHTERIGDEFDLVNPQT